MIWGARATRSMLRNRRLYHECVWSRMIVHGKLWRCSSCRERRKGETPNKQCPLWMCIRHVMRAASVDSPACAFLLFNGRSGATFAHAHSDQLLFLFSRMEEWKCSATFLLSTASLVFFPIANTRNAHLPGGLPAYRRSKRSEVSSAVISTFIVAEM